MNTDQQQHTLIFVYNAESGMANALLDTGRRIIQPKDYPCALCMVTYGPFGMKKDWKQFTNRLSSDVRFLHKDELNKLYPNIKLNPPGLVVIDHNSSRVVLDAEDFKNISTLDVLKSSVTEALKVN